MCPPPARLHPATRTPSAPRPVRTPVTRPSRPARPHRPPTPTPPPPPPAQPRWPAPIPAWRKSVGLLPASPLGHPNEVLENPRKLHPAPHSPPTKPHPPSTIVFMSQAAMTRGDAILAIESLLALPNGIAITDVGETLPQSRARLGHQLSSAARSGSGTTLDARPRRSSTKRSSPSNSSPHRKPCPSSSPSCPVGAPIAL